MVDVSEDIGFDEQEGLLDGDVFTLDVGQGSVRCVLLAVLEHAGSHWAVLLPEGEQDADEPEVLVAEAVDGVDGDGPVTLGAVADPAALSGLREALADLLETVDGEAG